MVPEKQLLLLLLLLLSFRVSERANLNIFYRCMRISFHGCVLVFNCMSVIYIYLFYPSFPPSFLTSVIPPFFHILFSPPRKDYSNPPWITCILSVFAYIFPYLAAINEFPAFTLERPCMVNFYYYYYYYFALYLVQSLTGSWPEN